MINIIDIQIILIIVVLGIANGFLNLWGVDCIKNAEKRKKYSTIWHRYMALLKVQGALIILSLIFIPIFPIFSWEILLFKFLLWFNFSWTIYDLIINWIRWYYENVASIWRVDDGAINGFLKRFLGVKGVWILRGILIIINILLVI